MFEGVTGEILLNEPTMLAKYLEDLSNEIDHKFVDRKAHLFEDINANSDIQDVLYEVVKKEDQLRTLVDFINILMERSQDKMLEQNETIERQDHELKELKEEKSMIQSDLTVLRQNFDHVQEQYKELEKNFIELEQKYDTEQTTMKQRSIEANALNDMKEKYDEVKREARRNTVMNQELVQEKDMIKVRLSELKEENPKLKEEIQQKNMEITMLLQQLEDADKNKAIHEKLQKDFEVEREAFDHEMSGLREAVEILDNRCRELEHDLDLAKKGGFMNSNEEIAEQEPQDDNNFNLKIQSNKASIGSRIPEEGNKDFERPSYSPDSFNRSPSIGMKGYFGGEENENPYDYENLRYTLTRHSTLENPFMSGSGLLSKLEALKSGGYVGPDHKEADNSASTAPTVELEKKNISETSVEPAAPPRKSLLAFSQLSGNKRKDILEEFYLLTWQSVLLNSTNFNEMAGKINPQEFFNELTNQGIPFFQWNAWITKRMEKMYEETVLPKKPKRKTIFKAFKW